MAVVLPPRENPLNGIAEMLVQVFAQREQNRLRQEQLANEKERIKLAQQETKAQVEAFQAQQQREQYQLSQLQAQDQAGRLQLQAALAQGDPFITALVQAQQQQLPQNVPIVNPRTAGVIGTADARAGSTLPGVAQQISPEIARATFDRAQTAREQGARIRTEEARAGVAEKDLANFDRVLDSKLAYEAALTQQALAGASASRAQAAAAASQQKKFEAELVLAARTEARATAQLYQSGLQSVLQLTTDPAQRRTAAVELSQALYGTDRPLSLATMQARELDMLRSFMEVAPPLDPAAMKELYEATKQVQEAEALGLNAQQRATLFGQLERFAAAGEQNPADALMQQMQESNVPPSQLTQVFTWLRLSGYDVSHERLKFQADTRALGERIGLTGGGAAARAQGYANFAARMGEWISEAWQYNQRSIREAQETRRRKAEERARSR